MLPIRFLPLRPLLLILSSDKLIDACCALVITSLNAGDALLLFIMLLGIAAVSGVILFRFDDFMGYYNVYSFQNIIRSIFSTYIFTISGENYSELVYISFENTPGLMIYFIVLAVIGSWIIIPLVVSRFQASFKQIYGKERERIMYFKRTGFVAAFALINLDDDDEVNKDEFQSFVRFLYRSARSQKENKHQLDYIDFDSFDDDGDDVVDIDEFITILDAITETVELIDTIHDADSLLSSWILLNIVETDAYSQFMLLVILIQLILFSLFGLYPGSQSTQTLDLLLAITILLNSLDISIRIFSMGWNYYWNTSTCRVINIEHGKPPDTQAIEYDPLQLKQRQFTNRFDVVIVSSAFIALIISKLSVTQWWFVDENNIVRIVMVITLLRLFTLTKKTRSAVYIIACIIPRFTSLVIILLIVLYIYAIIGVWLIGDELNLLLNDAQYTFETVHDSLITLFQVAIGEGWDDIMYSTVYAKNSLFMSTWYFVTFVFIIMLIFTNLFIGFVVSAVDNMESINQNKYDRLQYGHQQHPFDDEFVHKKGMLYKRNNKIDTDESLKQHNISRNALSSYPSLLPTISEFNKHTHTKPFLSSRVITNKSQFKPMAVKDLPKLMTDVEERKRNVSIEECTVPQIVYILEHGTVFDGLHKLAPHKHDIITYITNNRFDGNVLVEMGRKQFMITLSDHVKNKKLKIQFGALYKAIMNYDLSRIYDEKEQPLKAEKKKIEQEKKQKDFEILQRKKQLELREDIIIEETIESHEDEALPLINNNDELKETTDNYGDLGVTVKKKDQSSEIKEEKQNEQQCNGVRDCSYVTRIINALEYYNALLLSSNDNTVGRFIDFCTNEYKTCLEDYIHLICNHSDSFDELTKYLEHTSELINVKIKCTNINQCQLTQRHYRNRNKSSKNTRNDYLKENEEDEHDFYIDIFATLHFNLFHLQQSGLRTEVKKSFKNMESELDDDGKDDEKMDHFNLIDNKIAEIQKEIELNKTKYSFGDTDHSKFSIGNVQHDQNDAKLIIKRKKKEETTFMDNMFYFIKTNQDHDDYSILLDLWSYIENEEYDTDGLVSDIQYAQNCNILKGIHNNIQCMECMKQFVEYDTTSTNTFSKAFSTGIVFWYWEYYKDRDERQHRQSNWYNENDFGGYSFCDLFVKKHYNSLKEEVLESGLLSIAQFNKATNKGNMYLETAKCKNMECIVKNDVLHYDIACGDPLCPSHLYAVLLYCDFSDFCTEFSRTFRKIKWNETIESTKIRNSKYYHTSKYLRELVQYYGLDGKTHLKTGEHESGPFYTGMSFLMNIPSFSIRLNGPTSTSKQIEIAMRFSGGSGTVIQLNNRYRPGMYEIFFDTSWISAYPEEDERIWFGGRFKLSVESIIVMETKKNYKRIIQAFYKFDAILSGQETYGMKIAARDVDIINESIDGYLGDSSTNKLDLYMNDTFSLFANNKTQITLNLYRMSIVKNKEFIGLIMQPIKVQRVENVNNENNVFKPIIFDLFVNVQEIVIYSTEYVGNNKYNVYSFNMSSLLSILKNNKLPESLNRLTIKDRRRKWLKKLPLSKIEKLFSGNNFTINLNAKGNELTIHI